MKLILAVIVLTMIASAIMVIHLLESECRDMESRVEDE